VEVEAGGLGRVQEGEHAGGIDTLGGRR